MIEVVTAIADDVQSTIEAEGGTLYGEPPPENAALPRAWMRPGTAAPQGILTLVPVNIDVWARTLTEADRIVDALLWLDGHRASAGAGARYSIQSRTPLYERDGKVWHIAVILMAQMAETRMTSPTEA